MDVTAKTVAELAQALANKEMSSREITEAYLQRINAINPIINAYITVTEEQALSAATDSDARRTQGQARTVLDGVPLALMDNFCVNGVLTTCASKMLYNFVPPYSAACWQKLADAGAVLLAKANMDEFAIGFSTETSAYGVTRNPFAIEYVPGGSSGGPAAAVAADMAAFALASDTGGHTRQPAHYCGVVGLKPTYGRVSRFGIVPYASSLDQAGILAKSVSDAALILEFICGADAFDANTVEQKAGAYVAACSKTLQGLKVGLPKELWECALAPANIKILEQATAMLRAAGVNVEQVSLPHNKYALPAYYVLSSAEASSNMARFDGVNYGLRVERDNVYDMITATRAAGFGTEAKITILLGAYFTSAKYIDDYNNRALRLRTLVKQDYDKVFAAGYDCLLTPVANEAAVKLGSKKEDPLAKYLAAYYTAPLNLAGLPGISIPFDQDNSLPWGLQLIGRPFEEETLFRVAAALEQPRLRPPDILEQARQKGVV